MSKISIGLVVIAIICFILGIWPVGIAAIGALIYVSKIQNQSPNKHNKSIEELEKENEILRQELEQAQTVQRVIDKTEQKKS